MNICNHNKSGRSTFVMIYLGINAQASAISIAGMRLRRDRAFICLNSLRQVLRLTLAGILATLLMAAYFPTAMELSVVTHTYPFISVSSCLTPFAPDIHKTLLHLDQQATISSCTQSPCKTSEIPAKISK